MQTTWVLTVLATFVAVSWLAQLWPATKTPSVHGRNRSGDSQDAYEKKYGRVG